MRQNNANGINNILKLMVSQNEQSSTLAKAFDICHNLLSQLVRKSIKLRHCFRWMFVVGPVQIIVAARGGSFDKYCPKIIEQELGEVVYRRN